MQAPRCRHPLGRLRLRPDGGVHTLRRIRVRSEILREPGQAHHESAVIVFVLTEIQTARFGAKQCFQRSGPVVLSGEGLSGEGLSVQGHVGSIGRNRPGISGRRQNEPSAPRVLVYPELVPLASVQIFGLKGSQETRAAERFFKERRVPIHFVDLKERPMAAGEIRRFVDKFGLDQLIDTAGKAYADAGLKYLKVSPAELIAKTEREPKLLRLPFVRGGNQLAVGKDEAAWKAMCG